MEKDCKKYLSDNLEIIISKSLQNRVFSSCSIGYFWRDDDIIESRTHHYGYTDIGGKGSRASENTVYDLASLTKPLATSLAVMALVDGGKIGLESEIGTIFHGLTREMGKIKISQLLSHSSGLPAHRPYYEKLIGFVQDEKRAEIIKLIFDEKLSFQPGSSSLYSDLGFILLGYAIEKIAGTRLDAFWQNEIIQPIGLNNDLFFKDLSGNDNRRCAVTGRCSWSRKKLCGIVHDDNCRSLGGVAGHAGLFGTLNGVLSLSKDLLLHYRGVCQHPAYRNETLKQFFQKKNNSTWACGFDTPSLDNSTSGKYFSQISVGHLGYTGTSFWIDLDKEIGIVVLSNRVLMGSDMTKIKELRPLLHNIIMEHLTKKPD